MVIELKKPTKSTLHRICAQIKFNDSIKELTKKHIDILNQFDDTDTTMLDKNIVLVHQNIYPLVSCGFSDIDIKRLIILNLTNLYPDAEITVVENWSNPDGFENKQYKLLINE